MTNLLTIIGLCQPDAWLPVGLAGLALALGLLLTRRGRSGRRVPAWAWLALALAPALFGGLLQLWEVGLVNEALWHAGDQSPLYAAAGLAIARAPNLTGLLSSGLLSLALLVLVALRPPREPAPGQAADRRVSLAALTVAGVAALALASSEVATAELWLAVRDTPLTTAGTGTPKAGGAGQVVGIVAVALALFMAGRLVLGLRRQLGGGGAFARVVGPLLLLALAAGVQVGACAAISPLHEHTLAGRFQGLEAELATLPLRASTAAEPQLVLADRLLRPGAEAWQELGPDGQAVRWESLPRWPDDFDPANSFGHGWERPPEDFTILAPGAAPATILVPPTCVQEVPCTTWRHGHLLARMGDASEVGHLLSTIRLELGVLDGDRGGAGPQAREFYAEETRWPGLLGGAYSLVVPGVLLVDEADGLALYRVPQVPEDEEVSVAHDPLPPLELLETLTAERAEGPVDPSALLASTKRALAFSQAAWLHVVPGPHLSVQDIWTVCAEAEVASPRAPLWVSYEGHDSSSGTPEAVLSSCRIWPALPADLTLPSEPGRARDEAPAPDEAGAEPAATAPAAE